MSEITKRRKGQVVKNNERQLILNFFSCYKNQNPDKSVSEIVREISKATGCSERTIYKIKKEGNKGLKTTKKVRFRKKENKNSRNLKYDSFIKSSIRQKVYYNFSQNIPPTLNIILSQINNDPQLPNFRRSTLHTLLKEIGFIYKQKGKKLILSERRDLFRSRKEYLTDIQQFRNDNRNIIYTGGTVLNLMSTDKNVIKQVESCSSLFFSTTELVPGEGILHSFDNSFFPNDQQITDCDSVSIQLNDNCPLKGEQSENKESKCVKKENRKQLQLIVMHAVSSEGFIEGGEYISKKNMEDSDMYEYWFSEKILPKIPQNSVVVIDSNAPFFKADETVPDPTWKKQQIKNWLLTRNISVGGIDKKEELLDVVSNICPLYSTKYKLEELAKEKAVTVISLPPFHYELNPLNMVWAQIKAYVEFNMKSLKFGKVKKLVKGGFGAVSKTNWSNCFNNVKKMEELLWSLNEILDN